MNNGKIGAGLIYAVFGIIILAVGGFFLLNKNNSSNTDINFSLYGDKEVEIVVGNSYEDAGFVLYDKDKNDITDSVIVENDIDTDKPGVYIVKYRLDGNVIGERKVKVVKENNSNNNSNNSNNDPKDDDVEKIDDVITINYNSLVYTGKAIEADIKANTSIKEKVYYSDSSCKTKTTTKNASSAGGAPKEVGTYYVIVKTSGDSLYNSVTSGCIKALKINEKNTKVDDTVMVSFKSVTITGKAIEADIKANTTIKEKVYYSDSSCKTKTTTKNASSAGGAPKEVGTYYVIVKTSGDSQYNSVTSGCIKAIKINAKSTKKDDKITITAKSVTYTGKAIEADIKANTTIKEKVYYSDSKCKTKTTTKNASKAGGAPKEVGTYYVIVKTSGNSQYNSVTSSCKKAVQINHVIIKFDKTVINITEGSKLTLNISPKNTKVTYLSNNTKVATVSSSGVVTGKMAGSVKIVATSPSGHKAEISIVVLAKKPYKNPVNYNSSTFKYWIQYFNEKSGSRQKRYTLTNIWLEDPYNQIRVAHPSKSMSPIEIINSEIKTYGLQSKGLIAMNASVNSSSGLPGIPLVLDTGKDGKTKILKNTGKTSVYTIYGITKEGYLKTYTANSTLKDRALADGLKYTFGFYPVLINNYKYDAASVAARLKVEDKKAPDIKLAVCQIDKNNFAIITSWNFSTDLSDRRTYGLTHEELGDIMLGLKCKTGINLDGGSSVTYMYKKSSDSISYIRKSTKPDRPDILYFAQK